MILGIEIALLILGIYALATGKLTLSKNKVVQGTPARLLGIIGLVPLPLAFLAGVAYGATQAAQGKDVTSDSVRWTLTGIEAGIVVVCLIALFAIGFAIAKPPEDQKKPDLSGIRDADELYRGGRHAPRDKGDAYKAPDTGLRE
jgi:hypothetical protein